MTEQYANNVALLYFLVKWSWLMLPTVVIIGQVYRWAARILK